MSDKTKTPDELRAEIAQIDAELQQIAEQERECEHDLGELSLAARRGDKKAAKEFDQYDGLCAARASNRRCLQAARVSVMSELSTALALERTEATKAKAREVQEINEIFRKRGDAIDTAFRTATDEYCALLADAAALEELGAQLSAALVAANCRRAVRAALSRLKIDGVAIVPPLERHSFGQLCAKWSDATGRWASGILDGRLASTTLAHNVEAPPPAAARSRDVALRHNIHITDSSDPPNFEIKPAEPRVH